MLMKKYCFLLVVIALGSAPAWAQVDIGVKAGMNVSTVKYKNADPNTASIGFNAGALAQITVTKGFFIRPELLYSVKGYQFATMGGGGKGTLNLSYINIPLLAGFPVGDQFQFLAGPEIGFMTKASSKFGGNKEDVTDNFQHFDWGLDIGATCKITPVLGVEARYNYGFRGLVRGITTDQNGGQTGSAKDGSNRVFQVGLYYLLSKKS
jgi:Outer membrane protein beta-barrel domain